MFMFWSIAETAMLILACFGILFSYSYIIPVSLMDLLSC